MAMTKTKTKTKTKIKTKSLTLEQQNSVSLLGLHWPGSPLPSGRGKSDPHLGDAIAYDEEEIRKGCVKRYGEFRYKRGSNRSMNREILELK